MGIISGLLLMADPSGALVGFPSSIAEDIPFQNFFLVGLFLFVIYGLYPLFLAYSGWTRKELFFKEISRAGGIHWSWQGGAALIAILAAWLFVEYLLIGLDYPATYMTIVLGICIFVALVLPSTRRYFKAGAGGSDTR
jgi:hypothetical protein